MSLSDSTWSVRVDSDIELPTLRLLNKHELKVGDAGRNAHDGEGL